MGIYFNKEIKLWVPGTQETEGISFGAENSLGALLLHNEYLLFCHFSFFFIDSTSACIYFLHKMYLNDEWLQTHYTFVVLYSPMS